MHHIDQVQRPARHTRNGAADMSTPAPSGFHKPEAAGAQIGVTQGTLAKWRCAGTGPAFIRIGGRILYKQADLDAYLEARRVEPTSI